MQVSTLWWTQRIAVPEGAEMILARKGDAVTVAFKVCQVDEVVCLSYACRQVILRT